jgi:two-component system LytT family sensor kinase
MGQQTERFRLGAREIALIFLFWTSLATLSSVNRIVGARDFGVGRVISPAGPILLTYVEAWTWALLTPFLFWLASRSSSLSPRWFRVPLLIVIGFFVAIFVFLVLDAARDAIITVPRRGVRPAFSPLREIGRFRFLNQLIVYGAVLATGFAREFSLRDRRREQRESKLEAQLAEARLDALRMQINPHFLFNTLHAISALVERDPAGVRRMIARLSELLRHTIESRASDEVTLRDELAFLDRYLEIMEIRFAGRLEIERRVAPDVLDALVPNLVLQPILENALEHGVARVTGTGRIGIAAVREDDDLVLVVRDNGPGFDASAATGVGLANTRARLEQMYAGEATMTLDAPDGGGALVRIALPFHTAADRVGAADE